MNAQITPIKIGKRIEELILLSGKPRKEVADAADISDSVLSRIINGKYRLRRKTLEAIAVALGTSYEALVKGTDHDPEFKGKPRSKRKAGTPVRIYNREEIVKDTGDLEQQIDLATRSFQLSHYDCLYAVQTRRAAIERSLQRGVKVSLLFCRPDRNLSDLLSRLDPLSYPTPMSFPTTVARTILLCQELRAIYGERFEFRLLSFPPAIGLLLRDPEGENPTIKVELFTVVYPHRPQLLIPGRSATWKEFFLRQWREYWSLATSDEEICIQARRDEVAGPNALVPLSQERDPQSSISRQ